MSIIYMSYSKKLRGFDLLTCKKMNETTETAKVGFQLPAKSYDKSATVI